MQWVKSDEHLKLPIKSWCSDVDDMAIEQAENLANHPVVFKHVALMPDCHVGYGMPVGGVIATQKAVIPNAVGVDIGCGMCAVESNFKAADLEGMRQIRQIMDMVKKDVPVGEGHAHNKKQAWDGFNEYMSQFDMTEDVDDFNAPELPNWLDLRCWTLAAKNLGTLGGGNHFIELQESADGKVWLMLHSGSRNLGYRIAAFYHKQAMALNEKYRFEIPAKDLAFLPLDDALGQDYVRDMNFAMRYALENRRKMMQAFKKAMVAELGDVNFVNEVNIHHNYAAVEHHFGKNVWVHRKGATSARAGEIGIIPGSMGTSSYIVEGLGNPESFASCSHGAGRKMGRMQACRNLTMEDCDKAMQGVVYDRWNKVRKRKKGGGSLWDFGESPLAYKDIDHVIQSELDLIKPLVKLKPLGVVKG